MPITGIYLSLRQTNYNVTKAANKRVSAVVMRFPTGKVFFIVPVSAICFDIKLQMWNQDIQVIVVAIYPDSRPFKRNTTIFQFYGHSHFN